MSKFWGTFLCCICLFFSCTKDKDDEFVEIEYDKFVSLIYTKEISVGEVISHIAKKDVHLTDEDLAPYNNEIALLQAFSPKYFAHRISYHTQTPDGTPIVASGVIYYPKTKGKLSNLVFEVSPTNSSKSEFKKNEYLLVEAVPGMIGMVCIIPDLIGFGETDNMPIEYLQHENVAVVSADMRQAAEEFIHNAYKKDLSKNSLLFGYSLGGSNALSLARYYALHPERNVNIVELFIGGGAYNPSDVTQGHLTSAYCDYAMLPNVFVSMNHYDKLGLDFSEIFKGKLLENYKVWCDGEMPIDDITKEVGTKVSDYISESFIKQYNTPKYEKLRNAVAEKAIPIDWTPKYKIHLYHASNDTYVPTVCGDNLYETLKSKGVNVEYKKYNEHHVKTAVLMEVDVLEYLSK